MTNSKIKDLFLKSGMPLEVSVVDKLLKFDIQDLGEIEYQRDGKFFSTDILARQEFDISHNVVISFHFAIECKYKTKDHQWIFMEFPHDDYGFSFRGNIKNEVFDIFLKPSLIEMGYKLKKEYNGLEDFTEIKLFNGKHVNKGVEIVKNEFNPHIIEKAVSQAIFSSIVINKSIIDGQIYSTLESLDMFDFNQILRMSGASVVIPIVITNAKLYSLKENIMMEDIEKEKNFIDLLNEEKCILLTRDNTLNTSDFTRSLINDNHINSSDKLKGWINKFDIEDTFYEDSIREFEPNNIYIINYDHMEECFLEFKKKISDMCKNFSINYFKSSPPPHKI